MIIEAGPPGKAVRPLCIDNERAAPVWTSPIPVSPYIKGRWGATVQRSTTALVARAIVLGFSGVVAVADISGSSHDFAGTGWSGGEICKPCHTPHFADMTIGYLWSHELSSPTYTLYDGSVTDAGGDNMLDKHTRMCLSCHDGSVALDSYHGGAGNDYIGEPFRIGREGNLADDHPIGTATGPDGYPLGGNGDFNAAAQSGSGSFEAAGNSRGSAAAAHSMHRPRILLLRRNMNGDAEGDP
jgi:hypothetical protein